MSGMSGMSSMLTFPTLAFVFASILVGYTIWDLDQLSGRRYSRRRRASRWPRSKQAYRRWRGPGLRAAFSGQPAEEVRAAAAGSSTGGDGQPVHVRPDAAGGGAGGDVPGAAGGPVGQWLLSPAVTVGARVVMGAAMAFMLLILI